MPVVGLDCSSIRNVVLVSYSKELDFRRALDTKFLYLMPRPPAKATRPGEGYWSAREVAARLRVSTRRVTYLAETAFRVPGQFGKGNYAYYSSSQVLAMAVAQRLRKAGVKRRVIKEACHYLAEHLPIGLTPLTGLSFFTDGKTVLVETDNPEVLVEVSGRGQLVFALALHDVVLRCQKAGFLQGEQEREVVDASAKVRWTAPERVGRTG